MLPAAGRAQSPAAFGPALVSFAQTLTPPTVHNGNTLTWTGILTNGNPASVSVPDFSITATVTGAYTDPLGNAQSVTSNPVTVDDPAYAVDEKAHGVTITLTVPTLLQLVAGKSGACTVGPPSGGTYTITVPFGDVDGGQQAARTLVFTVGTSSAHAADRARAIYVLAKVQFAPLLPGLPPTGWVGR